MAFTLESSTDKFENAKVNYARTLKANGGQSNEAVAAALTEMHKELDNTLRNQIDEKINLFGANAKTNGISANERKFFNQVTKSDGFTSDVILPKETMERVFEDLTNNYPLLSLINFQNYKSIDIQIIKSETGGVAQWGQVFGEIKGQLDASFSNEEMTQNKLTAFIVLPKDLDKFGPVWVESYVRTQLVETLSVELERAILNGVGPVKNEPIGMTRDLNVGVSPSDGYAKKASQGTLTFADPQTIISELSNVRKFLSVKENGRKIPTKGLIYLVVNPETTCDIEGKTTIQNAQGDYVTNIPFDIKIIESEFVEDNELIACMPSRYDAYAAGGTQVNKYDQTLALEDCNLYTAKTFMTGKPLDNKVAAVYELNL